LFDLPVEKFRKPNHRCLSTRWSQPPVPQHTVVVNDGGRCGGGQVAGVDEGLDLIPSQHGIVHEEARAVAAFVDVLVDVLEALDGRAEFHHRCLSTRWWTTGRI